MINWENGIIKQKLSNFVYIVNVRGRIKRCHIDQMRKYKEKESVHSNQQNNFKVPSPSKMFPTPRGKHPVVAPLPVPVEHTTPEPKTHQNSKAPTPPNVWSPTFHPPNQKYPEQPVRRSNRTITKPKKLDL